MAAAATGSARPAHGQDVEALFHHHYTTTIQLNSTRQQSRQASKGTDREASSGAARTACGVPTTAAGRQATKYQPTNSSPGPVPRKVVRVRRCCSQFERIKEARGREAGRREGRRRGRKAAPIPLLLGASAKLIGPMQCTARRVCFQKSTPPAGRRGPHTMTNCSKGEEASRLQGLEQQ